MTMIKLLKDRGKPWMLLVGLTAIQKSICLPALDDTWIGGPQAGLRGSRQLKGRRAALVLVAVEKRGF